MQLYDSLARTQSELLEALARDGAVLALDLKQFEVVVTAGGINIQLKSIDPSLHIAIPTNAIRILLPQLPQFVAPPRAALSFAVSDHIRVGGTG